MIRKIIEINTEKCNGCGLCVKACHEGAIGLVDGKAALLRDDYCDGLGDCLPTCPVNAISFVEREAEAYDHAAVMANKAKKEGGCVGTQARTFVWKEQAPVLGEAESRLMQWPVQIKLAPMQAPYFQGAFLLIAADCTAYAYASFHESFMADRVTLIGCPKLDMVDYAEKLAQIIGGNDIREITVTRMEVPCCGGIELAVKRALQASGKDIPCRIVTISTDGRRIDEREI